MSDGLFVESRGRVEAAMRAGVNRLRALPSEWRIRPLLYAFGPRAIFLPATRRDGAAHLRIYHMAGALKEAGWQVLLLPSTLSLAERLRLMEAFSPDVLFMQGARHRLNRPWLYPRWPVVLDMDDADFHLPHLFEPLRRAMPGVVGVIAGSRYVADWCSAAGAGHADVVWTGAPVSARVRPPHHKRPPVIAWAQTRPMRYLAEADMVREVIRGFARRYGAGLTLRLFDRQPGDDPGFAHSFEGPGVTVDWVAKARYQSYLASFDDVALGLAPLCPETPFSRGKSFGKVLAYLDRMVPVLASAAGEHAQFFTAETGVVSNDPHVWVEEGVRLLNNATLRQNRADAAFWAFQDQLSLTTAAEKTDGLLRQMLWQARCVKGASARRSAAR